MIKQQIVKQLGKGFSVFVKAPLQRSTGDVQLRSDPIDPRIAIEQRKRCHGNDSGIAVMLGWDYGLYAELRFRLFQ